MNMLITEIHLIMIDVVNEIELKNDNDKGTNAEAGDEDEDDVFKSPPKKRQRLGFDV